jgi:glycosyltransferase involved in cell wall biosynthesis
MVRLMNKISIITVVRNGEKSIDITLSSILGQKNEEFEYIIIDGASTDNTLKIIKSFQSQLVKKSSPIQFKLLCELDSGIYDAMNKGIKMATGEYCLFLNSGDFLVNNLIIGSLNSLSFCEDIIYSNAITVRDGFYDIAIFPKVLSLFFWYNWSINHQNALIKRDLFNTIGLYNTNLKIASDFEFFIKAIFKHNCSIKYVNTPISCYDLTGISITNNELLQKERLIVLNSCFSKCVLYDYSFNFKMKKNFLFIRIWRKFTCYFRHFKLKKYINDYR